LQLDTSLANLEGANMTTGEAPSRSRAPIYLTVAWIVLLLLGAFFIFAPISDLAADFGVGLPSDHMGTFQALAGQSWGAAKQAYPGITSYITTLEIGYAFHELVFGIMFILILVFPFRKRERWAWFACWVPVIANLAYTLTFGAHDTTIFARSLIGLIALPVLLLICIPAFFFGRDAS
jgi:hypothetical protein